jgi:DNA-binding beta-propeller fold protein YncE
MKISATFLVLFLSVTALLFSCEDKDPEPVETPAYDHGVFILNEGNFTESDGSLSFFDLDSLKVKNNLFERVNGRPFAGVLQSMRIYNGHAYLVDQLGRIEVVREEDLESVFSVSSGFDIPRYFAGYQNRGYFTDWGPYDENFASNESTIEVYDLLTMTPVTSIETASRPEDIRIIGDKIYVANSATNVVSIYNVTDHSLINELEVSAGPVRFVQDKNENLWVICTGAYITTGALNGNSTDSDSLIFNLDLADYSPGGPVAINGAGDVIYFLSQTYNPDFSTENTVYSIKLIYNDLEPVRVELPEEIVAGSNWYGLGVDPETDMIYVADAAGFLSNGAVSRYDAGGNLIDVFDVGRGPRDFVFRNE